MGRASTFLGVTNTYIMPMKCQVLLLSILHVLIQVILTTTLRDGTKDAFFISPPTAFSGHEACFICPQGKLEVSEN